ncbi:MAG: hypothetical protein MR051_08895 [Lentisphaeria bacterium]|nr:hypothetical protein [Lentisphaeria bacterium]
MNRQIIRIFFSLTVFAAVPGALRADLPVASRVRLRNEHSGRDAEFLRATLRQLDAWRRLTGLKPPKNDLTVITGCPKFVCAPGVLQLPGDAELWERDLPLRRRICGALAAHRFQLTFSPESAGLAPWAVVGLEEAIRAADTMGRYVAGNRTYPLMAAFAARTGRLPDFRAMCRGDRPGGAVMDDFAAEQARLLLEILARNGRTGELFADMLDGKGPDRWLVWYTSPAEAQEALTADAAKLLWNRSSPLPPDRAEARIAELEQFFFPERLPNGTLSGRIVSGDIHAWAAQLASDRPDAMRLRRAAAGPWRELGAMLAPPERELCVRVVECVLTAGLKPAAPERFTAAVAALRNALDRRRKQEAYLRSVLDRTVSPAVRLRLPLLGADGGDPALSPAQTEFFSRTLDRYLR